MTIGVVALDVAARHFDFVLQDARKTGRVQGMFPKAGKTLFREARAGLEKELTSIRDAVNGKGPGADVPVFPAFRATDGGLFAAITSPREGVFCFPVKGRRMAASMPDLLIALKARFIDQNGLTAQQATEQAMAKALCRVLADAKLLPSYKRDVKIGPDEYQVTFALAHLKDSHRADRALRPLNFDLATSTEIFHHGDEWIQRLNRLQRMGYRPDRCLLALRGPRDEGGHRGDAYRQIREELKNHDFVLAREDETQTVVDFARLPESPLLKLG